MRDIIITLPRKIIVKILLGKKSCECRKTVPPIVYEQTRIWFVEKGTHYVRGNFTVRNITEHHDYKQMWDIYAKSICVKEDWFDNYAKTAKNGLYLWHIHKVYMCENNVGLKEYFGIEKNPQNYAFRKKYPFVSTVLMQAWNKESCVLMKPSEFELKAKGKKAVQ